MRLLAALLAVIVMTIAVMSILREIEAAGYNAVFSLCETEYPDNTDGRSLKTGLLILAALLLSAAVLRMLHRS